MVSNPAQATVTQLADDSAFGGVCSQSDQSGTYYNISPRGPHGAARVHTTILKEKV